MERCTSQRIIRVRIESVIVAEKHPFFTPFWQWFIESSTRNHFSSVRCLVVQPDSLPITTLWHGTHVSWWDGYLGLQLARHLQLEFRVMMLEENLKKYRFLRFAGAFGIDRGRSRGALESLRYAVSELQQPMPRALLMFPSGEIGSPHLRPIPFESGVATLANLAAKNQDLRVRPLAFRLEYHNEAKPTAYLRLGAPRVVAVGTSSAALTDLLRDDLEQTANALHQDLLEQQLEAYTVLLRGGLGIAEQWDTIRRSFGVKV